MASVNVMSVSVLREKKAPILALAKGRIADVVFSLRILHEV